MTSLFVLEHVRAALDAGRAKIERDPYPHVVVEEVLPRALYDRLEAGFPSVESIADRAGDEPIEANRTYLRPATDALDDPTLDPTWRALIDANTRPEAFEPARAIWREEIARCHPDLEANFGKPLDAFSAARRRGRRDGPDNRRADVVLDCQLGVNTPVRSPGSPRGAHVDRGAKLFTALVYFRDEKDDSEGGEYEMFRLTRGSFPYRHRKHIPDRYLASARRIPYRANTLVMWLNTPEAVHGVRARSVTPFPRRYVAVSGECFGGARPSAFFSERDEWRTPLGRLRRAVGL